VLAPAAQHLHTPPASARHCAHVHATRSAPLTFLPLQHLHRLSSTRAPASPKPSRSRSRARLTPVLTHACSRVARAHSEPQTHAYTGPVRLLHLCAPRCTPPAPASRPSQAAHQRLLHASHAPCTGTAYAAPTHTVSMLQRRLSRPASTCSCTAPGLRAPRSPARLACLRSPTPHAPPALRQPSRRSRMPSARLRSQRARARSRVPPPPVRSVLAASLPSVPCSWARLPRCPRARRQDLAEPHAPALRPSARSARSAAARQPTRRLATAARPPSVRLRLPLPPPATSLRSRALQPPAARPPEPLPPSSPHALRPAAPEPSRPAFAHACAWACARVGPPARHQLPAEPTPACSK
jgi:hypothetical protein